MGFEAVKVARLVEITYSAAAPWEFQIFTDMPGVRAIRIAWNNLAASSTVTTIKLRIPSTVKGRLWAFKLIPSGAFRLFGGRILAREVGLSADGFTWRDLPGIIPTSDDWQEIKLPIVPTSDQWEELKLPIVPTSDDWTDVKLPIVPTSDQWEELKLPIVPTSDDWTDLKLPIVPTSDDWTDLKLPIVPTSDDWTDLKLPIEPTSDEWQDLKLPIERTPDELSWIDLPEDE